MKDWNTPNIYCTAYSKIKHQTMEAEINTLTLCRRLPYHKAHFNQNCHSTSLRSAPLVQSFEPWPASAAAALESSEASNKHVPCCLRSAFAWKIMNNVCSLRMSLRLWKDLWLSYAFFLLLGMRLIFFLVSIAPIIETPVSDFAL